ncbi:hypothetical protein N0V82_006102 [Gnomoniopsis sp. IMI 355080]|nr:hypothetical protein N0V82_006102 [Gnomoniopsis sp. IMI 355080]
MKFFSAAIGLCLASVAVAAPAPKLEPRQSNTVVGFVDGSLNTLIPTVVTNANSIQSGVATIKDSVNAAVIIQAAAYINANLAAIVNGVNSTAIQITANTVNAAGGVAAAAANLTQSEISLLQQDVQTTITIIQSLNATIVATASLQAYVQATYQAEVTALENLLQPFLNPLIIFIQAAVEVSGGVTVTGLAAALVGLKAITNSFYQSLGLPTIS